MALKSQVNMAEINAYIERVEREYVQKIIRIMRLVGEKCINEARANAGYEDQTSNLRNSLGYVIAVDGVIQEQYFKITAQGKKPSKEDPIKYGKNLAESVAAGKQGIVLIVVAGMKYAVYVEATGRNVLTSAEQLANQQVPALLKALK